MCPLPWASESWCGLFIFICLFVSVFLFKIKAFNEMLSENLQTSAQETFNVIFIGSLLLGSKSLPTPLPVEDRQLPPPRCSPSLWLQWGGRGSAKGSEWGIWLASIWVKHKLFPDFHHLICKIGHCLYSRVKNVPKKQACNVRYKFSSTKLIHELLQLIRL